MIISGSALGLLFPVITSGESYGPAVDAVIDGCPLGMTLPAGDIQPDLDRRKPGTSHHVTQRKGEDLVEILSGVYEGKTTGILICLLIHSIDQRSEDYGNIVEIFRPGHVGYTHWHRYGIRDSRSGDRSSACLTAPTVAAGAIARRWLCKKFGIGIHGFMSQLGDVQVPPMGWDEVLNNPFFVPNVEVVPELETYMDALHKDGDSVSVHIEVVTTGVPVDWGEPLFDHLDADIARVMTGLSAMKGVEIGASFHTVSQRGSKHGNGLTPEDFIDSNADGVLGGISTEQDISVSLIIKPASNIHIPRRSIDEADDPAVVETFGRRDPRVDIRVTPTAKTLLAIVLIDHALRYRTQYDDVSVETSVAATKTS